VPIVCLAIWHWYMFLGDWLKSEYGVSEATRLSICCAPSSSCEKPTPVVVEPPVPPSGHRIDMTLCSSEPMYSIALVSLCLTGRTILAPWLNM